MKSLNIVLISVIIFLFCLAPACAVELNEGDNMAMDDCIVADDVPIDNIPRDNDIILIDNHSSKDNDVIPKNNDTPIADKDPMDNNTPKDDIVPKDGNSSGGKKNKTNPYSGNIDDDDDKSNQTPDYVDYNPIVIADSDSLVIVDSDDVNRHIIDKDVKIEKSDFKCNGHKEGKSSKYSNGLEKLKRDSTLSNIDIDIPSNGDNTIIEDIDVNESIDLNVDDTYDTDGTDSSSPFDDAKNNYKMGFELLSVSNNTGIERRDSGIFKSSKNNAALEASRTIYLNELNTSISSKEDKLSLRIRTLNPANTLLGADLSNAIFNCPETIESGFGHDLSSEDLISINYPIPVCFFDDASFKKCLKTGIFAVRDI